MGPEEDGRKPDIVLPDRVDGWRKRLDAEITRSNRTAWQWGTGGPGIPHDCIAFGARAVEAVLGIDLYAPYLGRYNSEESARRLVPDVGLFMESLAREQRWPALPPMEACDGDLALFDRGVPMLGVIYGRMVFPQKPTGLRTFPRSCAKIIWALGHG